MPRIPTMLERFYQPLYDTSQVTSQSNLVEFFTTAIENGKTIADTNMDKAGHLTYPTNFEIHGVSVKSNLMADVTQVKQFADGAWFRLFIGTKDYLVVPLSLVLDLLEEPKAPAEDLKILQFLFNHKTQAPVFRLPADAVIDLIPNLTFKAEIHATNANKITDNFKLTTILHGYYKRELH